ncbi:MULTISPECIES: SoxR reducing system RseC family protein [unclassified Oceanobacter]|jgi:sigma-E factor negative regulatory protein RseC|uniref:SoxR reducing system RseC family protein n=1 Tax=unclassified Oceanobacter TaxID=2620260 RepID=UPI0026E2D2A5|nr:MULTISPECIES: SoxR reducing system RseC family protein [unclassified Oceanobacter]MDO6682588.1 SoxR reducing system RseC family protein [Oceanobacter sp. 5_MG-2023]MDP2506804.1 SoxR reducing system RseC family protein [Oceanobacter sp. 3_MG-2023]MDP2547887.1 SoxR reducing system RseC family protein [Oceanobacter sp. 4_MG-2023]
MPREMVEVKEVANGGVWVEGLQQSACGSCNSRAGCGQATLSSMGKPIRLWVATEYVLEPGQQVVLDLPSGSLAASAATLYGVPLVGLILGAAAGQTSGGDVAALVVGVLGLAGGLLLARYIANLKRQQWLPAIVSVCSEF